MFECSKCTYSTNRKDNLRRHEKKCGTKEKIQHLCHLCKKQFNRKDYYTKHMNTHKKEKRFYCNLCPLSFTLKQNLKRHTSNLHGKTKIKSNAGFGIFSEELNKCQQPKTPEGPENIYFCKDIQCSYSSEKKCNVTRHEGKKHPSLKVGNLSLATEYRVKRKLFQDIEDNQYLKKKFKANEEKNIIEYDDINRILANRPGMSNNDLIKVLSLMKSKLGSSTFRSNLKQAIAARSSLLDDYIETEDQTILTENADKVTFTLTSVKDVNVLISLI